jgi:hypothetical protein
MVISVEEGASVTGALLFVLSIRISFSFCGVF